MEKHLNGTEFKSCGHILFDPQADGSRDFYKVLQKLYNEINFDRTSDYKMLEFADMYLLNHALRWTPHETLPDEWMWTRVWCDLDKEKDAKIVDFHGQAQESDRERWKAVKEWLPNYEPLMRKYAPYANKDLFS